MKALAALAAATLALGPSAPADHHRVAFSFRDPAIDEASALVALPHGRFATTNDSGDTGRVFTVDGAGRTVGVTRWSSDPTDVEALASCRPGRAERVWVGDTGDNLGDRDSIQVARVPVDRGERTVRPVTYDLVYPDGPHDAETLLCQPRTGRLFVVTKSLTGGTVYAAPKRLDPDRTNRLIPRGDVPLMATDGAFTADGRRIVVRGYLSAEIYRWPDLSRLASFALPHQDQGEGIALTAGRRAYLSSEGEHAPVLQIRLPATEPPDLRLYWPWLRVAEVLFRSAQMALRW